jgi:hypothetical protein
MKNSYKITTKTEADNRTSTVTNYADNEVQVQDVRDRMRAERDYAEEQWQRDEAEREGRAELEAERRERSGPYGVADYRQPLTEFERSVGVIVVTHGPVKPPYGSPGRAVKLIEK